VTKQSVTLRVDEDDLDFLAQLDLPGATSLSEKIRALLGEARLRHAGLADPAAAWDYSRKLYGTPERTLRIAELACQQRSELVARGLAALPELTAFLLSQSETAPREDAGAFLRRVEAGLADRLFALSESMSLLTHAGFPGCLDPEGLAARTSKHRAGSHSIAAKTADTLSPSTHQGAMP
jgi:hypothetical protein